MANDTDKNPARRIEDQRSAAAIDWSAPGAPAVPLSSTAGAARQGGITRAAFEEIAASWDGCRYEDAMIPDIGAALRRDFERFAAPIPPLTAPAPLTWQVQIRSGDDWRNVLVWDHGHTIPRDTFDNLPDALAALAAMESPYEEHSFRVHPIAKAAPAAPVQTSASGSGDDAGGAMLEKLCVRLKAMLGDEFHNVEAMLQQVRALLAAPEAPAVHSAKIESFTMADGFLVKREARLDGSHGWLLCDETGRIIRALSTCECDFVDAALAAPAQTKSHDIGALQEQSEAWFAVADVLHEVSPGWHSKGETGMASAVAAIRALAAPVQPSPTDLSKRLRDCARLLDQTRPEYAALMVSAADEIERYYGGMMAWKQTAEKKDRDWNAERMGRENDRIAARLAAPVQAEQAPDEDNFPISASTYGSLEECEKERVRRAAVQAEQAQAEPDNWNDFIKSCGYEEVAPGSFQKPAAPALPAQAGQAAAVRAAALEEAAKLCESLVKKHGLHSNFICAMGLRALAKEAAIEAPSQTQIDAVMAAIQHACGALPVGYEVILEMENGAGGVVWIDDENERHVIDGEGYITQDIYEAVEKAQAHASKQIAKGDTGGDHE
jgi:hypothetical protein